MLLAANSLLSADDILLSWNDNSENEDGFTIERSVGDGAFEVIGQTGVDVESYVDETTVSGNVYNYRVKAFNDFGSSGYTNVATRYINAAPSLTAIESLEVEENGSVEGLAFTVSDLEAPLNELIVSVTSNNPDLLDEVGMTLSGSGAERSLSLTPKANTSGEATIVVSVSDGEDVSRTEFTFVVTAYNYPSIDLAIDSFGSQVRAGESFLLSATLSDLTSVASVNFLVDGALIETISEFPYELELDIAEAGGYTLSAVVNMLGRDSAVSVEEFLTVSAAPVAAEIVASFQTVSIDGTSSQGSAGYDLAEDGFYLEDGAGEISGESDSHRFYFFRVEGDVSIGAKLSSIRAASPQSVAGLMLRSALFGKARQTSLLRSEAGEIQVRQRNVRGGGTVISNLSETGAGDSWLRIDKSGNIVRYYSRSDEIENWTLLKEEEIDLGDAVFVGFAVAGASDSSLASAVFTNAKFQGNIMVLGADATQPEVPSGLTISSTGK